LFRIASIGKEHVELVWLSEKKHPASACRAIVAVAWSKAIRRGFFLEKAVELGAAEIWCWQARRSQGRMPDDVRETWQGQLVAGLKQCGNPYLPLVRSFSGGARELAAAAAVAKAVGESSSRTDEDSSDSELISLTDGDSKAHAPENARILLHEPGEHCPVLGLDQVGRKGNTVYVIGPEGGFDPQETEMLIQAGYASASLGERPLRWETAAIMCLSLHRFCSVSHGRS
jgi:16S rRNA (uracil1498-N3)-methyltransferase